MSAPIDDLNSLVDDLEDEGHPLTGRFRDLVEHTRAELAHLHNTGNELDAFTRGLIGRLAPELGKIRDQIVADLHKAIGEIKTLIAPAEPAAPADANPADDAAAPAPGQVEPPATSAPAQG